MSKNEGSKGEVQLKMLLDRIEHVLARAGERWLDPNTGDEHIRAEWREDDGEEPQVCLSRRNRDGVILLLDALQMPLCQISDGQIEPKSEEALGNLLDWLEEFEQTLKTR